MRRRAILSFLFLAVCLSAATIPGDAQPVRDFAGRADQVSDAGLSADAESPTSTSAGDAAAQGDTKTTAKSLTLSQVITGIIGGLTSSAVLVGVLSFILRKWIGARIESATKHAYDVRLEAMREDTAVKNRAALVADLLSEWLSRPDDRTKLNRLAFEAYLWLPTDIANDLSRRLANQEDAPDVRAVLGEVRKHLLGAQDAFDPNSITIFPPKRTKTAKDEG